MSQRLGVLSAVTASGWQVRGGPSAEAVLAEVPAAPYFDDSGFMWTSGTGDLELLLHDAVDPGIDTGYTAPLRIRRMSGTGTLTLAVKLVHNATVISTQSTSTSSGLWEDVLVTFPDVDVATLPSHADLRLRINVTSGTGAYSVGVSSAYASIPAQVRATRVGVEVLAKAPNSRRSTRVGVEVLAKAPNTRRMTRMGVEVLARRTTSMAPTVVPLELPDPLNELFFHNWVDPYRISTGWLSDVTAAQESGSEERISLVDRPARVVSMRMTGLSLDEAQRVWMGVQRLSHQRLVFPLSSDFAKITAPSPNVDGDVTVEDARYRRFFTGQRCAFAKIQGNRPTDVQVAEIMGIGPPSTIFTFSLTVPAGHYPAGSRIYPLIDVEINLEGSGVFLTDDKFDVVIEMTEVMGPSALPASCYGFPTEWQTAHDGLPIFMARQDWTIGSQLNVRRDGESYQAGKSQVVYVTGSRPRSVHPVTVPFFTRAKAWETMRFFDSRRGRVNPFYLVGQAPRYSLVSLQSTTVIRILLTGGNEQDFTLAVPYVALILNDGTVHVREVVGVSQTATYYELTLGVALPGSLSAGDVDHVRPGYLSRMRGDEITEVWTTDEVGSLSFETIDLLSEGDVEVAEV